MSRVITMANTPSLKASSLFLVMGKPPVFQNARVCGVPPTRSYAAAERSETMLSRPRTARNSHAPARMSRTAGFVGIMRHVGTCCHPARYGIATTASEQIFDFGCGVDLAQDVTRRGAAIFPQSKVKLTVPGRDRPRREAEAVRWQVNCQSCPRILQ